MESEGELVVSQQQHILNYGRPVLQERSMTQPTPTPASQTSITSPTTTTTLKQERPYPLFKLSGVLHNLLLFDIDRIKTFYECRQSTNETSKNQI